MNALKSGSLGIAAALAGTLAAPAVAVAGDAATPQATSTAPAEVANVLDPPPPEGGPGPNPDLAEDESGRRTLLALTEKALPGVGASQIVEAFLYPERSGMSIEMNDGAAAVTFTVMPTKIARGKGIVAIGRF